MPVIYRWSQEAGDPGRAHGGAQKQHRTWEAVKQPEQALRLLSVEVNMIHTPQGCCPHLAHTTVLTASMHAYFH